MQHLARLNQNSPGQRCIALRRNQLSAIIRAEAGWQKKKSASGTHVTEELDALRISGVTWSSFSGVADSPACCRKGNSLTESCSDRQGADVLGIEPDGLGVEGIVLVEVDDGVGAIDALEGEGSTVSSARVRKSRSFLGDQPSRQRKLTKACGRKPASR